jgi:hypothetical protein
MKPLFKNKLTLTRNRQRVLLNFSLMCFIILISGLAFDSLFAAFMGGLLSSMVLRLIFASGNQREFGDDSIVIASNGMFFTKKHKRIVVSVMIFAAVGSWTIGVLIKSPYLPDFLPHIVILFLFQLIIKSTLFILDLPIGTFNENQSKVRSFNNGPFKSASSRSIGFSSLSDQDFSTSPTYRNLPGNINYNRHKWD